MYFRTLAVGSMILVWLLAFCTHLSAQEDANDEVKPAVVARDAKIKTAKKDEEKESARPDDENLFADRLTGDWGGARKKWAEKGFTVDVDLLQFGQGLVSGGFDREFRYSGKLTASLTIDGTKAGLVKNSIIKIVTETRYLDTPSNDTGASLPVNIAMIVPGEANTVFGVTEFTYTQLFPRDNGKDVFSVSVGKFNTLSGYNEFFIGQGGITRFLNGAFAGAPTGGRVVPAISNGGSFTWSRNGDPVFNFGVYDPQNTPTTAGIENLFRHGASFTTGANLYTNFFGKSGRHSFSAGITAREYTAFDEISQIMFPPAPTPVPAAAGSWYVGYTMSQFIIEDPLNKRNGWGIFAQYSLADEDTNTVEASFAIGLGGNRLFRKRPDDRFGIGYSYVAFSDPAKDVLAPFIRVGAEHQFEAFYSFRLRPWLWFTTDLQVVRPLRRAADTAVIPGARLQVIF